MRDTGKPVILSTGMATWDEVGYGAHIFAGHPYALLHSRSVYPAPLDELNLRMIHALAREFPDVPIGYSGHETGLATTVAAVTLGACIVERHITLDRAAWGTDQASSLEPTGFARMVKDIRAVERAMGDGEQRYYISEQAARNKLRPPNAIWKKQGQSKAEKAASSMVNK
jgi:sialic acid synthase SpsE